MTTGWLAAHCPRLAQAQADAERFAAMRRAIEASRTAALLECQRIEAHRELQLCRAQATNNRRYIIEREEKLAEARRWIYRLSVPSALR